MRKFILAGAAMLGIGLTAASGMAAERWVPERHDHYYYPHHVERVEHVEPVHRVYYPPVVPVVTPPVACAAPQVYPYQVQYPQPGLFFNGKHVAFGIGF